MTLQEGSPTWTSERSAHTEKLKPSTDLFRGNCRRGDRIDGPLCRQRNSQPRERRVKARTTGIEYRDSLGWRLIVILQYRICTCCECHRGRCGYLAFTERTKELSTLLWLHGEDHDPKE